MYEFDKLPQFSNFVRPTCIYFVHVMVYMS